MDFQRLNISSPKRSRGQTSGWDGFFPYYAGYPLAFASGLIASAQLAPGSRIFDPWNGSGTTTLAAAEHGHAGTGLDLNPVMVIIARARLLQPSEADALVPLATEICGQAKRKPIKFPADEPLHQWFNDPTAAGIRSIETKLRRLLVGELTLSEYGGHLSQISPIAAALYVALFAVCRHAARKFKASNPTWIKKSRDNAERVSISSSNLRATFIETVSRMADSLNASLLVGHNEPALTSLLLGDSTQSHVNDGTIDMVLSSPPYCTRIDYTAATRLELAIVQTLIRSDVASLSRDMIGSVRVPLDAPASSKEWGKTCQTFLNMVASHPSKASSGYYLVTHLDYFNKMEKSLARISSSLKCGGAAILIVQDSYYKEIHNDLASIITEMCETKKMILRRKVDYRVAATLSSTNPHARKYDRPRGAIESVLCFEKTQ